MIPKLIPLYSAQGELIEKITEQRLARLEELGQIARVVRHRKGHVNRAIRTRLACEGRGTELRDYLGTRYSFREHLDSGHVAWSMRKLGDGDELRPVFMQVIADCTVR